MDESFRVKSEGENYRIVQRTDMIRDATSLLNIYKEQEKKLEQINAQLDSLPRQKELMERDIKVLKKRMAVIEPHVRKIKKIMEREKRIKDRIEAEKAKAETLKNNENKENLVEKSKEE